jgi:hypothetical protein
MVRARAFVAHNVQQAIVGCNDNIHVSIVVDITYGKPARGPTLFEKFSRL